MDRYTSDTIFHLLQHGTPADWEAIARAVPAFPGGSEGELASRRWLINAIDCGSKASVEWMLSRGVEVNFEDEEGHPVLHSCLEREGADRYDILRMLLAAGADVNARGTNDWTPLHMAAAWDDLEFVRILLEHGADRSLRTRIDEYATPAEEAWRFGSKEAAKLIDDWNRVRFEPLRAVRSIGAAIGRFIGRSS